MKRLYLLRHAKSDWGDPGLLDHDRPLAPRGHRAAPKIAGYMAANSMRPSLVLVSSATRARETLQHFDEVIEEATVEVTPSVYGADVSDLMDLLRSLPPEVGSVLLVGHNPTMQDLALTLAARGPGLEAARSKFPTAALAVLDADVEDWAGLGPDAATMTSFVTPKQLEGG